MNKDEFKKNLHKRVCLVPIAKRVDAVGRPLEQIDDEWIVDSINETGAALKNTRNSYIPTLSYDQIHSYMADPLRSSADTERGFLVLKVQIYMGPDKIWVVPNLRPGESA